MHVRHDDHCMIDHNPEYSGEEWAKGEARCPEVWRQIGVYDEARQWLSK